MSGVDVDAVRAELAAARDAIAAAICPGTYCESHEDCTQDAGAALDALLPIVDRIARARAAAELRAAADALWSPTGACDGIKLDVNDSLRARANALDPT